jgi:phosphoenolpyruvate carboxylase
VLSKIERIAELIEEFGDNPPSERVRDELLHDLRTEISALWLTERARANQLAVTDEVKTGLYYVDAYFWKAIPALYDDLDQALAQHYPKLQTPPTWLKLASWIGGDRDGNPNVTAEVTAETLRLHRGLAVENHRRTLQEQARRLSISSRLVPPPQQLLKWIESRRPFPDHVAFIEERYATEPYRLALSLLVSDLAAASSEDMKSHLMSRKKHTAYVSLSQLKEPVDIIVSAMPHVLAESGLKATQHQINIFGLHDLKRFSRPVLHGRFAGPLSGEKLELT